MAESVQKKWNCSDNKAVQKRAYSSGKEDEFEVCKILEWKDEVVKSYIG